MTPLVRSASLTRFVEVAGECGLDPRALVAAAGLPRRCLDDPDLMVPAQAVGRLLESAASKAGEPAFGLRMAESWRLSNLGPLGLLVRDKPTLRDALEAIIANLPRQNEALSVGIEQVGNLVTIREELLDGGGGQLRQAIELVVGVTYRILSIFLGAGWRPRLVCFSHRAPASTAVHHRVLGRAVEFGHEFNGIVCNADQLDAPNPGADPVMERYCRRLLEQSPRKKRLVSERVREFVVLLLPRGHCRVQVVAHHLDVDRRTVARQLAAEGTSFSAIVDSVRTDLLSRYARDGGRPLAEVSALLGFSEPSAFSRWHRNRFGIPARKRLASKAHGTPQKRTPRIYAG